LHESTGTQAFDGSRPDAASLGQRTPGGVCGLALGIDIGSVSVKVCGLGADGRVRHAVLAHEGDLDGALDRACRSLGLSWGAETKAAATGGAGRRRLAIPDVIAPRAIEAALGALELHPRAVVSLGGEDLVVYTLDPAGRIQNSYAGNKCASGTGEFLRQQLGRMDLAVDDLDTVTDGAQVLKLSARCSVFMKSDCTHRLNKGEATKGDIALSLSKVMADKVTEFLIKAKIRSGEVLLIGGVTQNRHLVGFLSAAWPDVQFRVPEQALYLEAFGAAQLARELGGAFTGLGGVLKPRATHDYGAFAPLASAEGKVRYFPSRRGVLRPDAEYVLGVDGGSTTTKIALVDAETLEIAAAYYGRTHGDPVAALKHCVREVLTQLGAARPRITLCATTGSSRELLGVFLETAGVFNEIIAHAAGTTYFERDVDTIFEIGGQDAKYVLLNNGVAIDYAMNEACSAGTGSFLEESSAGDLDIATAEEIGPIALEATAPLKFGEHCSAFINSDIRKAIQQGAPRADIVAGLVFSIVANYLNRVVGNRTIGERVALQGGVAKNPAVPLAFAQLLGKPVAVPPDPELMGCFGVARLALSARAAGLLAPGSFDLAPLLDKTIDTCGEFTCQACENRCSIRNLSVDGRRYPFGGRCSKFTGARRRRTGAERSAEDHVAWRTQELFERRLPDPASFVARDERVVGVPRALSVHSHWPLYATFFHELGVRSVLSERVSPEGVARQESSYCFPIEIAHGAVQDLIDRNVDFLFLPHFRDMPSMEAGKVHACVCPLTQGLPYFSRQAFGLSDERVLKPVVAFKHGWEECRPEFERVAEQLGQGRAEGARAFNVALDRYRAMVADHRRRGQELLAEMRANPDRLYVALCGRPYNAFTRDANMGIPRKLVSRGVTVVPFDLIYDERAAIFPNMYWHYGQQDMKAVKRVREVENLFLVWISNFSCAPDSFMLHYVRWMMGHKPYLVLEIDSHSADAGIDTRVEAFLDVIDSYRRQERGAMPAPRPRRYDIENKAAFADVVDHATGERIDIRDPRVTFIWPSMGDLVAEAVAAASRKQGVNAEHLPIPDARSTQLARNVASGKECIPALLVLGSMLKYLDRRPPRRDDEIIVVYVPSTLGPCRTGQYHVFYDRLLEELGHENVVLFVGSDDNGYRELGRGFTQDLWRAIVLADAFTDARFGVRLLAEDVPAGLKVLERCWQGVIAAIGSEDGSLGEALKRAERELSALPKRRKLEDLKKVLVVGEIYVRRDVFSVRELCEHLIAQDVFPKLANVAEWVHYTDWLVGRQLKSEPRREGTWRALSKGWLGRRAWFGIEGYWKRRVERQVAHALEPTGLVPEELDDMAEALERGSREFVSTALESEAALSPAVAAAAMQDGYSGIAIIAPFGCLPGRLIEGVFSPWAKARGYPVLALENDGQPYPPNVVSRLEVFSHNVRRYSRPQ
jgi:predicted CoA-substrate-specific enzyme activase